MATQTRPEAAPTAPEAPHARPAAARTLADDLRARHDDALAALLRARPDLLTPLPTDMTNLVARANTRTSISRALEHLDAFTLQVVDALVYLPDPTTFDAVHGLLSPAEPTDVRRALERLREAGLVWGDEQGLRLVRTVRDVAMPTSDVAGPRLRTALTGFPPSRLRDLLADLGLPPAPDPGSAASAVADLVADPERFAALLNGAPPRATELLHVLSEGPPWGQVPNANRPVRTATAETPLEWLLARGLLVPLGHDIVVLPTDVAVAVRGGRLHRTVTVVPPPLDTTSHNPADTDRAAAGQAYTTITRIEELLDSWAEDPPAVLRAGGLGVRDLRRVATLLDVDEPTAALLVETAYAAGLVQPDGHADPVVLPTVEYDRWREADAAARWATIAHAWLGMTRLPALVGTRDERNRPIAALGPDVGHGFAAPLRRQALEQLAGLEPGTAATPDAIRDRLAWLRPMRDPRRCEQVVVATLREAEVLGVTGRGALASYARLLLTPQAGDQPEHAAGTALAPLLPEPVDHVLIQADLTAVAPGPLTRDLAAELALAADVESKGGATVYRFTDRSIRRALDAGRTADDLHGLLRRHSRTPVPQPLTYLVDDMARRHGRIRVGAAKAYVRCDDVAVLTELLADRRSAKLNLRRLAPTVLVADSSVSALLDGLRTLGYAPAAESADGAVVTRRPQVRRAPSRPRPTPFPFGIPRPTEPMVRAAVEALRAGDRVAVHRSARRSGTTADATTADATTADLVGQLYEAAEAGIPLQIAYVDRLGVVSDRTVHPIAVEDGYLTAYDDQLRHIDAFALHRIIRVGAGG